MSARRTPPSGATCWRGQFNIRWVVLMEVRPLRWVHAIADTRRETSVVGSRSPAASPALAAFRAAPL
jgi:hypothetical protein